jgi:cytochrome c biogenesis protein CcdA
LSSDVPLALAFSAGMVATVNPCGLPMLPAYLSFFVGTDQRPGDDDPQGNVLRALAVGLVVSGGFLLVFGAAGFALTGLSVSVYDYAPWVTIVIGLALAGLGVAMLAGFEPMVRLPKLDRGGRDRSLRSMFVFGVSYAIASLSCTLPVFVSVVSNTFRRTSVASGVAVYGSYALGMALVLMVLTLAVALARHSLVNAMRRAVRYVNRVSGALLIVAGLYVGYYGIYEIRLQHGSDSGGGVVDQVTGISGDISAWVQRQGAGRIGGALAALLAVTVAWALLRRRPAERTAPQ